MSWKELNRQPLEGELNVSRFIGDGSVTALQRIRKENRRILTSIYHEYGYMGFNDLGGRFRRRTPSEQFQLSRGAAQAGLRVLPPIDQERRTVIYPFLDDASTLDEYLPRASNEEANLLVYQIFGDLRNAHKQGFVYGDRWSRNMLISPRWGLINIDFDIEISGNPAIEFEIAQATYYALSGGKEKVIPILARILATGNWFNLPMVEGFLRKHSIWFNETRFGGIQEETQALIELARE
ncbi:MAG: hypothetical protein ACD_37C00195G0002 [uncultured bacterium]|nr:MAG: hypothetical protein ACD_37C00195G0002 [uncultured bacterium]KKR15519.1 MAG: hypothetical protein UT44_C0030G0002 [Candidatus Levybacteria bacterium GW2011_GWA1_39_32]KKR49791.1 MAG: hypothetical protein UT87_C0025G0003 [Candidatus Levybacteria bacterium GW2011_GWC1_40_19]KKR94293.1 MAG: hypothetical protein UU45_C0012G0003 [Candidatus Levybacteria bacterium GW2011_GWA2_41_15]KKS00676.1 MAG: hypothetical protein UU52_C0028G0002 [Candidatus Levybacteria bacterium GW2011_GWB1_41_21]OGH20